MDDETEVVLTANTAPYERSIDQATVSTNRMIETVTKLTLAIDGAFKSAGRTMQIGGAGMVAGITAAGYAAGRLDQQMSQLQASMTMASRSTGDYERRIGKMGEAVQGLRDDFGQTSQQAIALVTALNRMGQSSRDVDRLAQSFTKLSGVTGEGVTGLVDGMISLQRAMGTEGVRRTEVFNASLANLSQTAGTSATSILQFGQAIAPVAKVAGMSTKEVLGVSTAFVKAGADGYLAANAFNKMLTDITRSIQYGSPELKAYSNLIGVSVEEFKKMDRTEAITQIFEQINKQGPQAIKTLERFGLDGIRTYKSLQAVANQGGIRQSITEALGGKGTEDKFGSASAKAFDGLNDELKKMAESGKQIAEAFGSGVLPVMQRFAQGINAVLSPLTDLIQAMGKVPGLATLAVGAGGIAAGTITKHFLGISAGGAAYGGLRTLRQGFRSARMGSAGVDFSDAEQAAYETFRAREAGLIAPGNFIQHGMYKGARAMGGNYYAAMALRNSEGISGGPIKAGIQRLGIGTVMLGSSFLGSGLDPLSVNAQRNNFDRNPTMQMFRSSKFQDAIGLTKVKDAFAGAVDTFGKDGKGIRGFQAAAAAAKANAAATTTSTRAVTRYTSFTSALAGETMNLSKATLQATMTMGKLAASGAGAAASRFGAPLMSGARSVGRSVFDLAGGPAGVGILGGMALYGAYQNDRANNEAMLASAENVSALGTYTSELGEAAAATKTFTDVLKSKATELGNTKYTSEVTAAEEQAFQRDRSGLTYKGLAGTSADQARSIVGSVMAAGPSDDVKQSLKADLYKVFRDTDTVESILSGAGAGTRLDMQGLFSSASAKQPWWNPFTSTDARNQAQSVGDTLGQSFAGDSVESGSRRTLVALNSLTENISKKGMFGHQGDEAEAMAFVRGILGDQGTQADIDAVMRAYGDTAGSSGQERMAAVRRILGNDDSNIGRAIKNAQLNVGTDANGRTWNYNSMEMPSTFTAPGSWSASGVDQFVLDQLQGGQTGDLAQFIFGNRSGNSAVSRDVYTALTEEGNVNAQWSAMKGLADTSISMNGSFSDAIMELDKLKTAAGDSSTALYKMAASAQDYVRQLQSEAMTYMSRPEQVQQLASNFRSSQEAYLNNPNEDSGAQLEKDRQALEGARAATYNRMKALLTQVREFNVSLERGAEDYNRQLAYGYEDFARSRKYSEEDYARSRMYSLRDFNKSRRRQEEDFQHQVVVMTRNAARQIMNIYERLTVQRTWSASNLLANMRDQQERLAEQQANLRKLRSAGLSGDAISTLGLNDPSNVQQLARLADDVLANPEMIEAFNKAVTNRMKSARDVVTDEDSEAWKEMRYAFNKNQKRAETDFWESMGRQEEQFGISQARQREQFQVSLDRMAFAYNQGMERAREDLNRSQEEITGTFEDLAKQSLKTLTGSARSMLAAELAILRTTRTEIKKVAQGSYEDVDRIFKKLGINDYGMATYKGKTLTQGHIKVGDKWINVGAFAQGGEINGRSAYNQQDNIPIMATAGEYMQPVDAVNYYGKETMEALRKRKIPKGLLQGFADGGMVYKAMEGWVARNLPNTNVTSALRPGAITATGFQSMHALGKAVDLAPPSMADFNKIKGTFGPSIYELIYSPAGYQQMFKGKNHYYGEPTRGDHWDHIHWAMQTFGKALAGAFPDLNIWDGTLDSIVALVQKAKSLNKLDATLTNSPHPAMRKWGSGFTQRSVISNALSLLGGRDAVDSNYKELQKIDWKGDGALFNSAQVVGVGERGPEAVFPLDGRGADFMYEIMKRNASDSKKAMLANGMVQRASTVSYYQRVDKSTIISGPVTVQSADPDEFFRKMENKAKMEALKGRK